MRTYSTKGSEWVLEMKEKHRVMRSGSSQVRGCTDDTNNTSVSVGRKKMKFRVIQAELKSCFHQVLIVEHWENHLTFLSSVFIHGDNNASLLIF